MFYLFLSNYWNDILTVLTFLITATLAYYQVQYYRNQKPSLDLVSVTDSEYHDFDNYTQYECTIRLRNDGRDPVSIPRITLNLHDEEIELNNEERYNHLSNRTTAATRQPIHEFRTIHLGANEFDDIDLFGTGGSVDTTEPLKCELQMETSEGKIQTDVTFDRAP